MKNLESNYKFYSFMKKKIHQLKKFYSTSDHVKQHLSQKDLKKFSKYKNKDHKPPEDITIFSFIIDICRCVEVVNENREVQKAYFPS